MHLTTTGFSTAELFHEVKLELQIHSWSSKRDIQRRSLGPNQVVWWLICSIPESSGTTQRFHVDRDGRWKSAIDFPEESL